MLTICEDDNVQGSWPSRKKSNRTFIENSNVHTPVDFKITKNQFDENYEETIKNKIKF